MQSASLYILTGASRGMGLALAKLLLQSDNTLLTISRHSNDELEGIAADNSYQLEQWAQDLSKGELVADRLHHWLSHRELSRFSQMVLINNAAALSAMGPLRDANYQDLAFGLRVGLEAPMQLCAAFLSATKDFKGQRKILNISSGLGRRAMASASNYCAIKAGMDHFTRSLALEEALVPNGAKVCSLAPGVIDTDMQVQLRSAPAESFPDRGNFIAMHQKGILDSPDDAAKKLLAYLAREDFGANPVADVRE